jgi:pimeloyl-ACP methyl ester carboxylesterase
MGQAYQDVGLDEATMASHAADVLQLLGHLDVDRAVVGGLSMGGYISLAVARAAPGRLDGLILADTKTSADSEEGRAARDAMITKVRTEGVEAIADAMLPKLLGKTSQSEQPDLVEAVRMLILRNTPEAVASAVGAMKTRPDSGPGLSGITCPVLVICGAEDVLTPPSDSETMAAALPSATTVLIPRAGHLSNLEAPLAFNQALADFVARL